MERNLLAPGDNTRGAQPTAGKQADWTPVEEGVWPTPAQLLARILDSPDRLALLERILDASQRAAACFEKNHDGLEAEANWLRKRVAEANR